MLFIDMVILYFINEPAKFHYESKNFDKARETLNKIAKINKRPHFNGKFDKEIFFANTSREIIM